MALAREWFTAAELAKLELPGIPTEPKNVLLLAEREGWMRPEWRDEYWRPRRARGGGNEFHFTILPSAAASALVHAFVSRDAIAEQAARDERHGDAMAVFVRLPGSVQDEAKRRLAALQAVAEVERTGSPRTVAMMLVAAKHGVQVATLYNWQRLVAGVHRQEWLPHLAPRHVGCTTRAECTPDAWEMIKADFLRREQPNFRACYRRLQAVAAERGWTIPSETSLKRRIDQLPRSLRVKERQGDEALKRLYPAQQRDRGVFHALQAVNADGHKWDVFVRWPDGTIGRPVMVAFQDLYSGKILSWRVDRSENREAVRLAFGDMLEQFGVPELCYLDNGRNFASKWLTGGTRTRYRFKVLDADPDGIMTQLGVEVHWTTPYSGQSKPIERAFRDLAQDTAKHPAFAGAWTGNTPLAKPENYGSAAVPLDTFLKVIGEEIVAHNARAGRRAAICHGRSFDQTFASSYETSVIRKVRSEDRRLWLMAADAVRLNRRDGSVSLMGNQYWDAWMSERAGERVVIRFDPEQLHEPLHVYRLDGIYLGTAACTEAAGFNDVAAAQKHGRARRAWMRAVATAADIEKSMSIEQVAAMLPSIDTPDLPESKIVRIARPGAGAAAARITEQEQADFDADFVRAVAMQRAERGEHLRLVEEDREE